MATSKVNHYKWLDKHFFTFLKNIGGNDSFCGGIVSAHGDKFYGYKGAWEDAGIQFPHGVAICLLTYLNPWCDEVQETPNGWVDAYQWVIDNYSRFKDMLPPVDENDPDTKNPLFFED